MANIIDATAELAYPLRAVGIASIEKTGTEGLVDTYTITFTDGSTTTYEVTNGQNVTVDDYLDVSSLSSENPVQNRAIAEAINAIKPFYGTVNISAGTALIVNDIIECLRTGRGVSMTFTTGRFGVLLNGGKYVTQWRYDGTSVYGYGRTSEGGEIVFIGTPVDGGADQWSFEIEGATN